MRIIKLIKKILRISVKKSDEILDLDETTISSNQEVKYLIEKADFYIESHDYLKAIQYLDQIINLVDDQPHFYKIRGYCHRIVGDTDRAIEDYQTAIRLNPDDGNTYWELAPCYTYKISRQGNLKDSERTDLLNKALENYKFAIERIPTSPEAWLAIIETELRLFKYDDAISTYGACKPYITSREYKVIRSWLGCMAVTLEGDIIDEEDERDLNDMSIRLNGGAWSLRAVDRLLLELEKLEKIDKRKLERLKEIHGKLIAHFDEPPLRL